jgi:hypothetical protein
MTMTGFDLTIHAYAFRNDTRATAKVLRKPYRLALIGGITFFDTISNIYK